MPQDTLWLNDNHTEFALYPKKDTAIAPAYTTVKDDQNGFRAKSDYYASFALPVTILMLALIWVLIKLLHGSSRSWVEIGSRNRMTGGDDEPHTSSQPIITKPYLQYTGRSLNFSEAELMSILQKRSPFYVSINAFEKKRFLHRLKKFIAQKTFRVHDKSGFKEMPVLISASAIQLSFGLQNYLLPDFPVINIYPEEFLGLHPSMRFLEGNVSHGELNISWKHFLKGFAIPDDGQNVGLHEWAHAYHYQNLHCSECEDDQFKNTYPFYELTANKVFEQELLPGNDLYSAYALKNFQEFWAESVELFFERPVTLKTSYPALYEAIQGLLNQDTEKLQRQVVQ